MKNGFAFPAAFLAVLLCMPPAARGQIDQTQPVPALQTTAAALRQGLDGSQTGSPYPAATPGSLTLDVVVTDKSGAAVSGLQPADFKLFDNSQPQSIVSLRAVNGMKVKADPPVEVILLVDAINPSALMVADERQWLMEFFKENGGELALPTSLIMLTNQGMKVQDHPSRNGKALLEFLDANATGLREIRRSEGLEGAVEREQASLNALDFLAAQEAGKPGRKLLIWVSTGWHLFSNPRWDGGPKDEQILFNYVVGLSTALRAARITLYSVDPAGAGRGQFFYQNYLKCVDGPTHADYGALMLQVAATQTGGQALSGNNDLAGLIDRCIKDAQNFYVLTFNPPPATHANEYHALRVEIAKPGLKARTRAGYYADPAVPETQSFPTAALQTVQEVKE
jgi:VWFA-related protein